MNDINITLSSSKKNEGRERNFEGFYSSGTLEIYPDIPGYIPIAIHLENFTVTLIDSEIRVSGGEWCVV